MTPYRPARGSIAVECAFILPVLVLAMTAVLFFGRVLWHYTVVQKAAHDAARFLATTSLQEIMPAQGGLEVPVARVAHQIAATEVEELAPGGAVGIAIRCQTGSQDWGSCSGQQAPRRVMARVEVAVRDPFFAMYTDLFMQGQPVRFQAAMATDYVGN